jgi:hypothetical protein
LTLKQQKGLAALLTCSTLVEAAKEAGVGERSLRRWLKQDTFRTALRHARSDAISQAGGRLQRTTARAVAVLDKIIRDEKATAATRVSAVRTALRYAYHSVEVEDFEERLSALERARKARDQGTLF